jgi:photosystem II stability/assembly factor-like uncharacterized protein
MKLAMGAAIGVAALIAALGAHGGTSAVPAGFDPDSLAALDAGHVWLIGTVPCRADPCPAVLRSSDGGRSFVRMHAPPLPVHQGFLYGQIRFADVNNGFASAWQGGLYATHDGGRSWHKVSRRSVLAFATGGGVAYAVTGRCVYNGPCRDYRFERSSVSRDAWKSSALPFARAELNFDLVALGRSVWLFGGSSLGRYQMRSVLARSTNRGVTFVTGTAPCDAELAADLEPVSSRVVWAFCPTGLMGRAFRSTNRGVVFTPLGVPHCCANSTSLGAVSEAVAVVSGNAAGTHLLRTTDGGGTWRPARTPADVVDWGPFEFVGRSTGFSLVSVGRVGRTELLRTTDAGASWHRVPIR